MRVNADMTVEELIGVHPEIASFLAERGIVCLRCGEPYWGTLRELAGHKGLQGQIDQIVAEIIEQLNPGARG
jgi:hypothetical protein